MIGWLTFRFAGFLLGDATFAKFSRWTLVTLVIGAVTFICLWLNFGFSIQFACLAVYTAVFLIVLITDIASRAIFPVVLVPATILALAASPLLPMGFMRSLLGGILAFIIVFGIYAFAGLYSRWRKLKIQGGAFGRGDVYLATFMGVVVGFPAAWYAIIYTVLLSGVFIIFFLAYQYARTRRFSLTAVIPYGPFFCIAGWAVMTFMI
jgi:prepilin signal peptidase PulO-like enzyme (type II secretory pathway)